jgi:NhaA family Na+:H+ antiporter
MGVFFFAIGLELKREILEGELSTPKKAMLPIAAAIGGMIVPAIIFAFLNWGEPSLRGWGIPVATDIAFAIGVLSFAGKMVPSSLKVFLTALAIVDDLGAVLIIALFYSASSAFHPAILGVLIAALVPLKSAKKIEHSLQPWVNYLVMPVFALANAGVAFEKFELTNSVSLGIVAGLVFGKQIGITLFSWLSVKLKLAHLPRQVTWFQIYGVAWLGGIGFTMSLFIANLAFRDQVDLDQAKLGILLASFIAAIGGLVLLRRPQNS